MLKVNLIITLFLVSFLSAAAQNLTDEVSEKPRSNNLEIRIGLMSKFSSENIFNVLGLALS